MMDQKTWEESVKNQMIESGWKCDRDDEENLGFHFIEDGFHWIRDYCKKTRTFVQYNGNQVINLISTKENK